MEGMEGLDGSEDNIIARLKNAWRNERFSPELLPSEQVLIDRVMQSVETQERHIEEQWEKASSDDTVRITLGLQQSELDRVRFMLRSYLRTRIQKVEKFCAHYLSPEQEERLSPNEHAFATRYRAMVENHYEEAFLKDLPPQFRSLTTVNQEIDMVPKPQEGSHVFCYIHEDLPPIELGVEFDPLELKADDTYMTRYELVRDFVESNRVSLV